MFLFFNFSVLSVFAQTSTNSLPPLAPAYPGLPPTFWEQHQSASIVAGFGLLAVAFLFLRLWLRPETPAVLAPELLARQALAKLQSQPEDGKLLSEVSQCLRRYVSETFNLPDQELTTAEFCSVIAGHQPIGAELAEIISSFLRECDVQKFSPANCASPLNAASRALEIISLAEKPESGAPPVPR
jgi:hypothetical protein